MVAGRYLRSKRREGFISVIAAFSFLGIMLGVATLIIVMSVMNGFREELIGRIVGINGHINVYDRSGSLYPYEPVIERLKKIDGVVTVTPTVEGQALLNANGVSSGVAVRGLPPKDFKTRPLFADSIQHTIADGGETFGEDRVAVGTAMAERMGLNVGSVITLISPQGKTTPFGTMPRSRSFTVGSIFDVGMFEYNNSFVFMPLDMAKIFFDKGEGVSAIEITTPNPANVDPVRRAIQQELAGEYAVADWRDNNSSFYNAIQVERNVMFLILTLIIIVAAFNIISSLIMLVKDKGRDIAILRTMGAGKGMIIRIFFYTGASIGIVGTIAGTLLGVAFAANIESIRQWLQSITHRDLFSAEIYFLSQLPAKIDAQEVIVITTMALVISFIATIYPAWRAARLDPVEGLRRE